ncbi:arylamine N-acetyltransferase family protein [Nocardia suismassiliense]|uniref:arylamine N-acetyltransferase family protein n=1 Tax=Nocardia suismassiliense TaxID=2077092 RepID=UPI000D1E8DDB|nr:arylamine N-acetyltransferase [Nocardia suismassiliense]
MSEPTDPAYHWNGADLDLDGYLARIGFDGERAPTLDTLRKLVHAHTTSIPFENLEIILGRTIPLDLKSLQDKLVRQRRGGYCYEHVGLFAAALERLGFGITALHARVTMGATEGLRPATHALLRVTTSDDDRVWLCDVGFGAGPLAPIELSTEVGEFTAGDWRFRLELTRGELDSDLWVLHQFDKDGWHDRYTFAMTPQYRIDFAVGNHFVSTSPRSPFTTRPYAQRFLPDVHRVVDGTTVTTERPDGTSETRQIEATELPKILAEEFDIELTEDDAAALVAGDWRTA